MKKDWKISIIVSILLMITVSPLSTIAGMNIPANDKAKENAPIPVNSPVNDWILDLPITEIDWKTGNAKIEFVHYKEPKETKAAKAPACYNTFAKWPGTPINYVINPSNPQGLDETFVLQAISNSAETWDDATITELFNPYTINYTLQTGFRDYNNVIDFGPYGDPNVIAVTYVWYNFFSKQIYETDIRFNTLFTWGNADIGGISVMDLQNIGTHEFGHVGGMNDIYKSPCGQVTMYGYSGYGETKKRTLEAADITGIRSLYG